MDPVTVSAASVVALLGAGTGAYWRRRACRAERTVGRLRQELQTERHAACHDPLTGLLNRRAFYQFGRCAIEDPHRRHLAVVVVDLNGFKQINDEFGHATGDEVLITVARRLSDYAGDNLVARLGGDEFVGLLTAPALDEHWQYLASHRLAEVLAAPMLVAGHTLVVTASIGIAAVPPVRTDLTEVVRRADAAMYRAKSRYRSKINRSRITSLAPALDEHLAG